MQAMHGQEISGCGYLFWFGFLRYFTARNIFIDVSSSCIQLLNFGETCLKHKIGIMTNYEAIKTEKL